MTGSTTQALLIIDVQNDFCPGGSLAVPEGDAVVPIANALQKHFKTVVATKDWHPNDHMSFATNHPDATVGDRIKVNDLEQILWPDHYVQESPGSEFHPQLQTHTITKIFYKGTDKTIDSYSAFYDNAHQRATGLDDYLKSQKIDELYILGLATDYCVKYSVLDALQLGYKVYLITDGCKGVELRPGDIEQALAEMKAKGAEFIESKDLMPSDASPNQ